MTAATVTINTIDYEVYASLDYANAYLAGDMARAATWADLSDETKAVALVSATRLLLRQNWLALLPPLLDGPPDVVAQACSMLAADIAVKPTLGDTPAPGSNVKSIGTGSTRVEFFAPTTSQALPTAVLTVLLGLIGSPVSDDPALDNVAFGSNSCQTSRFDPEDYRLNGDDRTAVDRDELYY